MAWRQGKRNHETDGTASTRPAVLALPGALACSWQEPMLIMRIFRVIPATKGIAGPQRGQLAVFQGATVI
jgi:hypothetical protein